MSGSNAMDSDRGTGVAGERGQASVQRMRSLQSRLSGVLAAGLMLVVGIGLLVWYYGNAIVRAERVRDTARRSAVARAQAEMPLPTLGRIDPPAASAVADPQMHAPEQPSDPRRDKSREDPQRGSAELAAPVPEAGVRGSVPLYETVLPTVPAVAATAPPVARTPAQLARERRLTAHLFGRGSDAAVGFAASGASRTAAELAPASQPAAAVTVPPPNDAMAIPMPMSGDMTSGTGAASAPAVSPAAGGGTASATAPATASRNTVAVTAAVAARVLPTRRFLLPKGAFIDCTLETAIDSTLPGLTTCVTATDTYGSDGQVVLLERGTKLIGETRGQVQQGAARVYVMWTEARTPTGVAVPLESPGTDELGRAGLPGVANRHFWERFGAALLISLIDGGVQAAVQSGSRSNGTIIYTPTGSHDIMTEVLRSTVNIPPTVVKPQGDRVQALVAHDVDFRAVYELRLRSAGR